MHIYICAYTHAYTRIAKKSKFLKDVATNRHRLHTHMKNKNTVCMKIYKLIPTFGLITS